MKTRNVFLIAVVIVVMVSLIYSFQGGQDKTAYFDEIKKEREEKDHFMRTSPESPVADQSQKFSGLKYYPPNTKYRIAANLSPVADKKVAILATSDAKEEHYLEYAYAEFDLDGLHNKLLIYEIMEMGPFRGKLFLAFGDETSALETYGGGRYLDIAKVPGSSTITLDFNKAYNPYCAYSEKFSCPLPPPENLLRVAIKAGERSYHN